MEYVPRRCTRCGAITSELKDGKDVLLACTCDWEIQFLARLQRTVAKEYIDKSKTMGDWSPSIFHEKVSGRFKRLIKIQKAVAIEKVYDYAFKPIEKDGRVLSALAKSVATGKNLFIRGPRGSGRGLITAAIKTLAAARGITATSLPGTFDVFKDEMMLSKQMGITGADMRILVADKYEEVALLALEGLRGENLRTYTGEKIQKKHGASDAIDRSLSMRSGKPGSMLLSGPDFIQEIGDTAGDRLFDVLMSDSTSIILLFSPIEADAILSALKAKKESLEKFAEELVSMQWDDKKLNEKSYLKVKGEELQAALYFEEAFQYVPTDYDEKGAFYEENKISSMITQKVSKLPKPLQSAARAFQISKEAADYTHVQGLKSARLDVMSSCKSVSSRMSMKELEEAGRLIGLATGPKEEVARAIDNARTLRDKMAGKSDDI